MVREFEFEGLEGLQPDEPMGLPQDLLTNPAKYDGDIPFWRRTVMLVKQYETSRPKGRESLLDQAANSIVKEPSTLMHLLNNFDLVGQLQPDFDVVGMKERLIICAEQAVARRSNLPSWTPTKIEELIKLALDNSPKENDKQPVPQSPFFLRRLFDNFLGHEPTKIDARDAAVSLSSSQRLVAALFNAPKTIKEAVDLYYNSAWAMVATSDPETQEEIFSILCCEKFWFPVQSPSYLFYRVGNLSGDDSTAHKQSAIREVLDYLGLLLENPNLSSVYHEPQRVTATTQRFMLEIGLMTEAEKVRYWRILQQEAKKNPARFNKFLEDMQSPDSFNYEPPVILVTGLSDYENPSQAMNRVEKEWEKERSVTPKEFRRDPNDPLLRLVYKKISPKIFRAISEERFTRLSTSGFQKLTQRSIELPSGLQLAIMAKGYNSPEQRISLVREVYDSLINGESVNPSRKVKHLPKTILETAGRYVGYFNSYDTDETIIVAVYRAVLDEEIGRLSSVLEYHRPLVSFEQVKDMNDQIIRVRGDLQLPTRSVGRRGYQIMITDPALRHYYGYESITLKQTGNEIIYATLVIDGQDYKYSFGTEYRIRLGDDIISFVSPQDQAWLELLTLSHIKKLVYTGEDNEELKAELLGGERQLSWFRKQMVHRGEHLRKLPPGQKYSTNAFELCLKSHLPVPPSLKRLDIINRMRAERGWGGTPETGIWTYVSGVERDIDTQIAKPVKVAFKNATEDMRKVIDLGAISNEELDRLEKEILAELEVEV